MTLRSWISARRRELSLARVAWLRKSAVRRAGAAPVSPTCQIPDLRSLYRRLGLPERSGTFVEVGAFDGETFSNTSFLADQGWRGVYVEPIPAFCTAARVRHLWNDVAVDPVAITGEEGRMKIQQMGPLTSSSTDTVTAYREIPWARGSVRDAKSVLVRTDTLPANLSRNGVPERFELMVIDVEGAEEPIVDQLVESRWRPKVLIIELVDRHSAFDVYPSLQASARRVRDAVTSAGYHEDYMDEINSVFVSS